MNIKPLLGGAACFNCWSAYPGVHSDSCPASTAKACVVCGAKHHQGKPDGRCLLDDEAHRNYTAQHERAA